MRRNFVYLVVAALSLTAIGLASCNDKRAVVMPPIVTGGELGGTLATTGSHYAHPFNNTGVFNYECTIHSACGSLHGTVVVMGAGTGILNRRLSLTIDGGSAGGPYGGASCSSLSSVADTVLVGDTVTWTNNSPLGHNVTSD